MHAILTIIIQKNCPSSDDNIQHHYVTTCEYQLHLHQIQRHMKVITKETKSIHGRVIKQQTVKSVFKFLFLDVTFHKTYLRTWVVLIEWDDC